MVIDGLKGNDVDLVSLDHCTDVPSHLTALRPAAQNYDSCLVTMDSGEIIKYSLRLLNAMCNGEKDCLHLFHEN